MKHRWLVSTFAFLVVTSAAAVHADTVNVLSGDSSWHAFETPTKNNTSTAFWNRWSFDGIDNDCNIGYWLSGTGGCSAKQGNFNIDSPGLTPEYLGSKDTTWEMDKAPTTESVTVTTRIQVTAFENDDVFGWYDATSGVRTALFSGVGILNASATFFPTGDYGFYMWSPQGQDMSGGAGAAQTHFAVFRVNENGTYWIGVEDMFEGADYDYNDVVFRVTPNQEVPEPATLLACSAGLVGLIAARRRRRRA